VSKNLMRPRMTRVGEESRGRKEIGEFLKDLDKKKMKRKEKMIPEESIIENPFMA